MKKNRRGARAAGCALGILLAGSIVVLLLRGFGALLLGGAELLREAAGSPERAVTAAPATMPPLEEENAAEETRDSDEEWADPVELPIVSTPEQLAETAVDLTPPPDAPIG